MEKLLDFGPLGKWSKATLKAQSRWKQHWGVTCPASIKTIEADYESRREKKLGWNNSIEDLMDEIGELKEIEDNLFRMKKEIRKLHGG